MATLQEHQAVLLELLGEFDRVCRKNHIPYLLFAGSALGAVRHQGFIPWDDDLDVALLREDYDRLMKLDPAQWGSAYYLQKEYAPHWPMYFSKLRKNNTTCLEKYHPKDPETHQGIYIDVFPIDNAGETGFLRKIQFAAARVVVAKSLWKRGYDTHSAAKKAAMVLSNLIPRKLVHGIVTMKKSHASPLVHSFLGGSICYRKGVMERKWFTTTVEMPFESLRVPVSAYYHQMLSRQYGDYMTIPPEEDRKCKVHGILVDTEKGDSHYRNYRDGMEFDVFTRSIR